MAEEVQSGSQKKRRWRWVVALVAVLLVALIVPPMVSISQYKSGITRLISQSLGRPVRLSSVELRLLPRPGFVLTNLTVQEDPAFGPEPILHANQVVASIRILSLWQGRLEIGTISVDEASLNLVHTSAGRWNLDSLFHTAAAGQQSSRHPLPYLEATNSRINVKDGLEKLPFSIVSTDLSFWQQGSGEWRLRLKGQPARTDMVIETADTGIVRLEAALQPAAATQQVHTKLDMDWKDAQLGQLTRLLAGSDPGWRGNLTGELHLEGTTETAQVKGRLRATGVHRAEFAPADPMDFDAQCNLVYHYNKLAAEKVECNSPIGDGKVHLTGQFSSTEHPALTAELDKISVSTVLDALRTVRSDFAPGLEAKGTVSGKLSYAVVDAPPAEVETKTAQRGKPAKVVPVPTPLSGSLAIDGLQLSGNGLSSPVVIDKLNFTPVAATPDQPQALTASSDVALGGGSPLAVSVRVGTDGYLLSAKGAVAIARARELSRLIAKNKKSALDTVEGDALTVDLSASGPWMPSELIEIPTGPTAAATIANTADRIAGTVTLHNANWKADFLANTLQISQATLHLSTSELRLDPVAFSYGPVKGTAVVTLPAHCSEGKICKPHFEAHFAQLESASVQAALFGAQQKGTLISTLLEKLHPVKVASWPAIEGTIKADTLLLGTVSLRDATAQLKTNDDGAELTALNATLFGGHVFAKGLLHAPVSEKDKPSYSVEWQAENITPTALGQLLNQQWGGKSFATSGKVQMVGFTAADLSQSATGSLSFDWQKGTAAGAGAVAARFDRWSGDAEIANGSLTLKQSLMEKSGQKSSLGATVALGAQPKVSYSATAETQAKR